MPLTVLLLVLFPFLGRFANGIEHKIVPATFLRLIDGASGTGIRADTYAS